MVCLTVTDYVLHNGPFFWNKHSTSVLLVLYSEFRKRNWVILNPECIVSSLQWCTSLCPYSLPIPSLVLPILWNLEYQTYTTRPLKVRERTPRQRTPLVSLLCVYSKFKILTLPIKDGNKFLGIYKVSLLTRKVFLTSLNQLSELLRLDGVVVRSYLYPFDIGRLSNPPVWRSLCFWNRVMISSLKTTKYFHVFIIGN